MAAVTLRCQCGRVECSSTRPPMLTAVCYCDDCQAAAREIETAGCGPPVADADGGTALSLFRNDRFSHTKGAELLAAHKLRENSPTSRMVASCCDSAMFLAFADTRFWVSVMNNRIVGERPRIESRLAVEFRASALPWPDEAPRYKGYPKRYLLRLLGQWIAMNLGKSQPTPAKPRKELGP